MFKLSTEDVVVKDEATIHPTVKANLNRRANIFLTGPGGTGKSFCVEQLVKHTGTDVLVTASTGIAAMNIGGVTVHSWCGMGTKSHPHFLKKIVSKNNHRWPYIKSRILAAKVLVVDEIGMLKAGQLDLLNDLCRYAYFGDAYKKSAPFGGIQVLFTGDFLQLPPVATSNEDITNYLWPFESSVWKEGAIRTLALSEIFRQKDDLEFCKVLNKVRLGIVDADVIHMLKSRVGAQLPTGAVPMRFVGTNEKVRKGNQIEYDKATGRPHQFKSLITVDPMFSKYKESVRQEVIRNTKMEETLQLKEGMPVVMLCNRNVESEYFMNGSLGTFIGVNSIGHPIVKIHKTGDEMAVSKHSEELKLGDGKVKGTINQFPMRIAHYSTFHKSQGLTLDYAEVDMSAMFSPGMGYVGLSRVTSLEGLVIKNFNPKGIRANKKALRFYGMAK